MGKRCDYTEPNEGSRGVDGREHKAGAMGMESSHEIDGTVAVRFAAAASAPESFSNAFLKSLLAYPAAEMKPASSYGKEALLAPNTYEMTQMVQ